jgi:hypothetical protein
VQVEALPGTLDGLYGERIRRFEEEHSAEAVESALTALARGAQLHEAGAAGEPDQGAAKGTPGETESRDQRFLVASQVLNGVRALLGLPQEVRVVRTRNAALLAAISARYDGGQMARRAEEAAGAAKRERRREAGLADCAVYVVEAADGRRCWCADLQKALNAAAAGDEVC